MKKSIWQQMGQLAFGAIATFALALVVPISGLAQPISESKPAEAPVSPAQQAYDELQSLRHKHGATIWGAQHPSKEALQLALGDLDAGLARIKTPLITDLSYGSKYLAARRIDFQIDKVRALYRLGDLNGAAGAWRELNTFVWFPTDFVARADSAMRAWLESEEFSDLRKFSKTAAWLATPNSSILSPHPLTREERIAGLSMIWSIAREYFVWFDNVPELDWDRAYLDAIARVIDAPDESAYWRELMRFTTLLHDGHSNAYPPESMAPQWWSRPGLGTARVENKVLVVQVRDNALKGRIHLGDEIVSIDNEPTEDYVAKHVTPYQSSSTPQDLDVRRYDYGLLAGAENRPVILGLRRADGTNETIQAPRSGYETAPGAPNESFEVRQNGLAVLVARQFENGAAHKLLETHSDELMKAKALIIDLRGNGGGSSGNGFELLRWLTNKPLPTLRQQVPIHDAQLKGAPIQIWQRLPDYMSPVPLETIFKGPVALLMDARTFSAAEDTAAVFKLMRRGSIIGMPSGGSTGQPLMFPLPGGGTARICAKRDSYPDGSNFVGIGVQPDVLVPMTAKSVRDGIDLAMETAELHLLRHQ